MSVRMREREVFSRALPFPNHSRLQPASWLAATIRVRSRGSFLPLSVSRKLIHAPGIPICNQDSPCYLTLIDAKKAEPLIAVYDRRCSTSWFAGKSRRIVIIMVWAVMFQGITVFVFIIIFCKDKHNQAIVSRKKRFWYSVLLFIGIDVLFQLFLVKESQILILSNIFGGSTYLAYILLVVLGVLETEWLYIILLYFVNMPVILFLHFPSFLIFWIQFSKNKKIKIKTTVLYVLWCAITIWLCLSFPTREQRAAELQRLEEKRYQELMQKVENSAQEESTEKVPPKQ